MLIIKSKGGIYMKIKGVILFIFIYILTFICMMFSYEGIEEKLFKTTDIRYLTDTIMKDYKSFYSYYDNGGQEKVYTLYDEMPVAKRIALLEIRTGYINEDNIGYGVWWYEMVTNKKDVTKEMVMEEIDSILRDYKKAIISYKRNIIFELLRRPIIFSGIMYICIVILKSYAKKTSL